MHGLPGQSIEEGLEDLKKALSLGPTHLSWYQLTIEPNTEFYARPPPLPEEDLVAEMQDSGSSSSVKLASGAMRFQPTVNRDTSLSTISIIGCLATTSG